MLKTGSIADLRRDYTLAGLRRADLAPTPLAQFHHWFDQAVAAPVPEPNAMTLATTDTAGQPSARIVLLKAADERGFVFFTNYDSRKGRELTHNPRAALVFFWPQLERQICVSGQVTRVSAEESTGYFNSRPRGSRLAAWTSSQSEAIADRAALEERLREITEKYPDEEVARPPHWGGYCLAPARVEFWQGRPNRLHDRFQYRKNPTGEWIIERLSP